MTASLPRDVIADIKAKYFDVVRDEVGRENKFVRGAYKFAKKAGVATLVGLGLFAAGSMFLPASLSLAAMFANAFAVTALFSGAVSLAFGAGLESILTRRRLSKAAADGSLIKRYVEERLESDIKSCAEAHLKAITHADSYLRRIDALKLTFAPFAAKPEAPPDFPEPDVPPAATPKTPAS